MTSHLSYRINGAKRRKLFCLIYPSLIEEVEDKEDHSFVEVEEEVNINQEMNFIMPGYKRKRHNNTIIPRKLSELMITQVFERINFPVTVTNVSHCLLLLYNPKQTYDNIFDLLQMQLSYKLRGIAKKGLMIVRQLITQGYDIGIDTI